jgi:excisionase family DNA binding protein
LRVHDGGRTTVVHRLPSDAGHARRVSQNGDESHRRRLQINILIEKQRIHRHHMSTMSGRMVIDDAMLTIDEAAAYLTIPKSTLYTWRTRRAGFGPRAVKLGGCLRYRRVDLDAWIVAHLEDIEAEDDIDGSQRGKAPNPHAGVSKRRRSSSQN